MYMRSNAISSLASVALLIQALAPQAAVSQEVAPPATRAWTVDEALEQLRWYPRDAYLQFVALQLARREQRAQAIGQQVASITRNGLQARRGRAGQADLFSIFSGALAIQESLQMDTMRGEDPDGRAARNHAKEPDVDVSSLSGPTIKSHPWKEMLGDKQPEISPLAKHVPADFYFIQFRSLGKLADLIAASDSWGRHLFSQANREAKTQLVGERIQRQLAVETSPLLRPFYDAVVAEVAITGSDLFLREGSDVTLVFQLNHPDVFEKQMEIFLANAEKRHPQARRERGKILDVDYEHAGTADRSLNVYWAYPAPNLHVRSNSRVALERVLAAIRGRNAAGQPVERLGDTLEFAYIRTLMPHGAPEEDGFVYLSDPFIRRMVGPELKLTMRRRTLCYNHLRMIGHAAMLYRTEKARAPVSLAELEKAECTPGRFGEAALACPDGGTYQLSAGGVAGTCSHHGDAQWLTPCCEIPTTRVTPAEAADYKQFLEQYNQYWRTFFDPIAVRLKITPRQYRVETIVLPLIDNSIYTGLALATGGAIEPLESLPVPERNIFTLAAHLNKQQLIKQFDLDDVLQAGDPALAQDAQRDQTEENLRMIGLAMHNYHDTYNALPTAERFDDSGRPRLSWRVHILPFIKELKLYEEFHLDEPWDSEHNKKLIPRMPVLFASGNEELARQGKTRFVAPIATNTVFTNVKERVGMAQITDGTSNTVLLVEADDAHAVVWTKPEDLPINEDRPFAGLQRRKSSELLVLMADGGTRSLKESIAPRKFTAILTRSGSEADRLEDADQVRPPSHVRRRPRYLGLSTEELRQLNLGELLTRGIGDQVALHLYDADPMFTFSLPTFLGMSLGTFQNRGRFLNDEFLLISVLISSLNAPVYVSIPVQDPSIVDLFLGRLDGYLALATRADSWEDGFLGIRTDAYKVQLKNNLAAHGFMFEFGPVKWRFCWARIGRGLYLASQPYVLEDLHVLENSSGETKAATASLPAHALVHLRPEHWKRVLDNYRFGWSENNRQACLQNLGPLSNVSRVIYGEKSDSEKQLDDVHRLAAQLYDARFFCPEGGQYLVSSDSKQVTCNIHGSIELPRQKAVLSENSQLGKLLDEFAEMTLTLTFLEDGLHAVMTIDRQ